MIFIIFGIIAFVFFFLYDINSIIMKQKLLKCSFFAGFLLLMTATVGIVITSHTIIRIYMLQSLCCGVLALLFLGLLIYTLFFALPFKNTYINSGSPPKVYREGVYALCRHPGVIWFMGFYTFFALSLQLTLLLIAAVTFSILNILYVLFQDRWTFVKYFENYEEYKLETPFLIPNKNSIKRCLKRA